MNKSKSTRTGNIVRGILSVFILFYLLFAFLIADHLYASEKVGQVKVTVENNGSQQFVNAKSVLAELGTMPADSDFIKDVDLSSMERKLKQFVNIEDASVNKTIHGNILVNVVPMIPVARVFDSSGYSYYINSEGKKLQANARYHVDVPIISGYIDDSVVSAVDLLPIMNFVAADSLWNSLTTAFKVEKNHDLLLIPMIKGHVVNLGDYRDKNTADKFRRLATFYREVMPKKGWQYYDTISVKFDGQIVATRAKKRANTIETLYELEDSEEVDLDNMDTNIDNQKNT